LLISHHGVFLKKLVFELAKSEVENVGNPIDFNVKGFVLPSLDYCVNLNLS
ncbi:21693_t:CDS:1, partial [Gigaspora rosea]